MVDTLETIMAVLITAVIVLAFIAMIVSMYSYGKTGGVRSGVVSIARCPYCGHIVDSSRDPAFLNREFLPRYCDSCGRILRGWDVQVVHISDEGEARIVSQWRVGQRHLDAA